MESNQINQLCGKIAKLNNKIKHANINITSFKVCNTYFVDIDYGNDLTAEPDNPSKPYKTLLKAANEALGEIALIYVRPGEYETNNLAIPNKKIFWYFENGCKITSNDILWNLNEDNYYEIIIWGLAIFETNANFMINIEGTGNKIFYLENKSIINNEGNCISIINSNPQLYIETEEIYSYANINLNVDDPSVELFKDDKSVIVINTTEIDNPLTIISNVIKNFGGGITILIKSNIDSSLDIESNTISTIGPTCIFNSGILNINSIDIESYNLNFINLLNANINATIVNNNNKCKINCKNIICYGNENLTSPCIYISNGNLEINSNLIENYSALNNLKSTIYVNNGNLSINSISINSQSYYVIEQNNGNFTLNTNIIDNRLVNNSSECLKINNGELNLNINENILSNNGIILHSGGTIKGFINKSTSTLDFYKNNTQNPINIQLNINLCQISNGDFILLNNSQLSNINIYANSINIFFGDMINIVNNSSEININLICNNYISNGNLLTNQFNGSGINYINLFYNYINITNKLLNITSNDIYFLNLSAKYVTCGGILISGSPSTFENIININNLTINNSPIEITTTSSTTDLNFININCDKIIGNNTSIINSITNDNNDGMLGCIFNFGYVESNINANNLFLFNNSNNNFNILNINKIKAGTIDYVLNIILSNIDLNIIESDNNFGSFLNISSGNINGNFQNISSFKEFLNESSSEIINLNLEIDNILTLSNNSSFIFNNSNNLSTNFIKCNEKLTTELSDASNAIFQINTNNKLTLNFEYITGNLTLSNLNVFLINQNNYLEININNIDVTGYIVNSVANSDIYLNINKINIDGNGSIEETDNIFNFTGNGTYNIYIDIKKFVHNLPSNLYTNILIFNFAIPNGSTVNEYVNIDNFSSIIHTGTSGFTNVNSTLYLNMNNCDIRNLLTQSTGINMNIFNELNIYSISNITGAIIVFFSGSGNIFINFMKTNSLIFNGIFSLSDCNINVTINNALEIPNIFSILSNTTANLVINNITGLFKLLNMIPTSTNNIITLVNNYYKTSNGNYLTLYGDIELNVISGRVICNSNSNSCIENFATGKININIDNISNLGSSTILQIQQSNLTSEIMNININNISSNNTIYSIQSLSGNQINITSQSIITTSANIITVNGGNVTLNIDEAISTSNSNIDSYMLSFLADNSPSIINYTGNILENSGSGERVKGILIGSPLNRNIIFNGIINYITVPGTFNNTTDGGIATIYSDASLNIGIQQSLSVINAATNNDYGIYFFVVPRTIIARELRFTLYGKYESSITALFIGNNAGVSSYDSPILSNVVFISTLGDSINATNGLVRVRYYGNFLSNSAPNAVVTTNLLGTTLTIDSNII